VADEATHAGALIIEGMDGDRRRRTRILIADDHAVSRAGLAALLEGTPEMEVVGQAGDGQEAIELFRTLKPDVVLMDLAMPGVDGLRATTAIVGEDPDARVIVLTVLEGDEDIHRALGAGARGYLLKDASARELLEAVRAVQAGMRPIAPAVAARLAERVPGPSELTSREVDVLRLLAEGRKNGEIAQRLKLREATIKVYVNRILGKLGVNDRTEAAMTALRRGLVRLE
jgi:two-component system NarL family response regulator